MHRLVFPGVSKSRVIVRQTECVCYSRTPYFFTGMRRWEKKGRICNWDTRPRKYLKVLERKPLHMLKCQIIFAVRSSPPLAKYAFLWRPKMSLDAEAYGWSHSRISEFHRVMLILKISASNPSVVLNLQLSPERASTSRR